MRYGGCICILTVKDLIQLIFHKAYKSRYSIHPGNINMYRDLNQHYWWSGMKIDIVDFVSYCLFFSVCEC